MHASRPWTCPCLDQRAVGRTLKNSNANPENARRARPFRWLPALTLVLLAGGCGPAIYTVNVISATSVVDEAAEAGAPEMAPYEYYFARAHLEKGREEAAEGNYQDAIRYIDRATSYGARAREKARQQMRERAR